MSSTLTPDQLADMHAEVARVKRQVATDDVMISLHADGWHITARYDHD